MTQTGKVADETSFAGPDSSTRLLDPYRPGFVVVPAQIETSVGVSPTLQTLLERNSNRFQGLLLGFEDLLICGGRVFS